jgi:hypothetical protein
MKNTGTSGSKRVKRCLVILRQPQRAPADRQTLMPGLGMPGYGMKGRCNNKP